MILIIMSRLCNKKESLYINDNGNDNKSEEDYNGANDDCYDDDIT